MKCVLFDMDGVLLDSEPVYLSRLQRHMDCHGVKYTEQQLMAYVGMTSLSIAGAMIEKHGLSMTPEEFLAEEVRLYGSFYLDSPELAIFDGARELLTRLGEQGVKTALVSSSSGKSVLSVLDRFGLGRCFDVIVCRDMVQTHKPSPEPYQTAAQFLGAEPGECVVVEDSPVGIAAGKAAGMRVIAVKTSRIRQDTSKADVEVEDHGQLWSVLEKYL